MPSRQAVAERIPAELVSADSMQVYRGLPLLTNQDAGARLVGIWPLDRQGTVGEFQQLAHETIDEIVAAGRTAVVVGGSGLWFQAALTDVELPADVPDAARARWERLYERFGPKVAHGLLERRDPRAAAQVHPNDRKRVVRALELWQAGGTLVPEQPRLWTANLRLPTVVVGLEVPRDELARRIEARAEAMFELGVDEEVRAAGDVAPQVLGLDAIRTLPREEAIAELVRSTQRLAAYQRKWMRRIPGVVMIDAQSARGRGGGCGSRSGTRSVTATSSSSGPSWAARSTPELAQRLCDVRYGVGSDGVVEVVAADGAARGDRDLESRRLDRRVLRQRQPDRCGLARAAVGGVRGDDRRLRQRYPAALRDDGMIAMVVGDVEVGEIETVEFDGERVELTAVSVGNPHAVVRAEPDRETLLRLGPQLETNDRFPERTNVQLVRVDGPNDVTVARLGARRGGDERLGLERRRRRGGRDRERLVRDTRHRSDARRRAAVELDDENRLTLVGPAEEICEGELR